ncbi:MAG: hypothetical protein Q7S26_02765 [bacterium]|nr:hypothetical protein [bacterium]
MKPLYVFLLLWAVFITGLADGISWALMAIPGIGFILALAITFCINATMGAGLLFLLISQGMYHPKFGPATVIGGLIPGINVLPFWIGLVVAGIVHDMGNEKGMIGEVAKLADNLQSTKNPLSRARSVMSASKDMRRLTEGRPPQIANDNEPQNEREEKARSPLNLKSPRMNDDIQYAKAA